MFLCHSFFKCQFFFSHQLAYFVYFFSIKILNKVIVKNSEIKFSSQNTSYSKYVKNKLRPKPGSPFTEHRMKYLGRLNANNN